MAEQEAGRELDALVAERIMGIDPSTFRYCAQKVWSYRNADGTQPVTGIGYGLTLAEATAICERENALGTQDGEFRPVVDNVAHYSTDITAAWLVVEKLREGSGIGLHFLRHCEPLDGAHYAVAFCADFTIHCASAATAPLAICLAALACVTASEPK